MQTGQIGRNQQMITSQINTIEQPIEYYKSWDVNAVLRDIYDLGEMILARPLLLGEVAKQIHDEQDIMFDLKLPIGTKIEWGISKKNMTPEKVSLFKTWNFKENEKGFEYTFEYIPVQIIVYKNNYAFFKNPDMKFYKVDDFDIPNPFDKYWKARYLIK